MYMSSKYQEWKEAEEDLYDTEPVHWVEVDRVCLGKNKEKTIVNYYKCNQTNA